MSHSHTSYFMPLYYAMGLGVTTTRRGQRGVVTCSLENEVLLKDPGDVKQKWLSLLCSADEEGRQANLYHARAFSSVPSEFCGLNCKRKLSQNNTLLLEFHPVLWMRTNSFTQHPHPAGLELLLCYKTATQILVRILLQHPPCYQRWALACPKAPNTQIPSDASDLSLNSAAQSSPAMGTSVTTKQNLASSSPYNLPGSLMQQDRNSVSNYSSICMAWRGSDCHQRPSKTPCKDAYRPFKRSRQELNLPVGASLQGRSSKRPL